MNGKAIKCASKDLPIETQITMALFKATEPLYHCVELAIDGIRQDESERVLGVLILMKSYLMQYTGRSHIDKQFDD